jgi:Domain of unknown function (DUF5915)
VHYTLCLYCVQAVLTAATKLQGYMKGELNVWDITVSTDEGKWCTLSADPNNKLLGKRFGKGMSLTAHTRY